MVLDLERAKFIAEQRQVERAAMHDAWRAAWPLVECDWRALRAVHRQEPDRWDDLLEAEIAEPPAR
mgnify:CR=1 FL=1